MSPTVESVADTPSFAAGEVRIVSLDPAARGAADRVNLSAGSRLAGAADGDPPYRHGARVPALPFRIPFGAERDSVWGAPRSFEGGAHVVLLSVGEHEVTQLRAIHESAPSQRTRTHAAAIDREAAELLARLGDRIACSEVVLTGVAEHARGQLTVTANTALGARTGLHVDSWYDAPLARRHGSPGRLCLNVGKSDRWFLFVNRPLAQIGRDLGLAGAEAQVDDLARRFLERFPNYPVVRVRIAPGEAYIAPTENLIHDGSTVGTAAADLSYTYRGHFRLAAGGAP